MKWLAELFERVRPRFVEGARFQALGPLFRAVESFFFLNPVRTTMAPHIRDPLDIKRFMSMVIVALLPCVAASVYFFGLRVLVMIAVSYVAGGTVEVLFAIIRKHEINEGFLVTGLLFPLLLPPALPLWAVAVGVTFGVFVGKELFGGTGRNLFNPALVGRCFLALGYPSTMAASWASPGAEPFGRTLQYISMTHTDAITSATPLVLAKQGQWASLGDLFFGRVAGSVGETSALAILAGGLFLLCTRVANWRTVVGILGSFALLAGILHWVQPDRFGSVAWHLFAGGLLLGAFFMATDPVTGPITRAGKWIYGVLIGVAVVLIRNFTGYVEGVMFAILFGNIVAPILDEAVIQIRLGRLQRER